MFKLLVNSRSLSTNVTNQFVLSHRANLFEEEKSRQVIFDFE